MIAPFAGQVAQLDEVTTVGLTDTALEAALEAGAAAGLPPINVAPNQGKLLHLVARAVQAGSILEVGTLGGYSTIWLARALPAGGRLATLESDPKHAEAARADLARAGLAGPDSDDPCIYGIHRFDEVLAAEPRVSATVIQTVGSKGHGSFALALGTG